MINNIEDKRDDMVKVALWLNVIFMAVSIFYVSKILTIILALINTILLGCFFILEKYGYIFTGLITTKKIAKGLNKSLGEL